MMHFKNRWEAGKRLADSLSEEWVHVDVVYAIPRGGIEAGASVAKKFGCPLLPVLVAKIRHPKQPELAIGALDETGRMQLRLGMREEMPPEELSLAVQAARLTLESRRGFYAESVPSVEIQDKTVVLVDDGLATGQSCRAALKWLRGLSPGKLLLAVPCASTSGLEEVRSFCDGVVTLAPPDPYFTSVGSYYDDFEQVPADSSLRILREANQRFLAPTAA
jgi:putative phosphoribosyl transferase